MTALVHAVSRLSSVDIETLRPLLISCGAVLFVAMLYLSYGLDLSYGFF
jgi:hypothetical protein